MDEGDSAEDFRGFSIIIDGDGRHAKGIRPNVDSHPVVHVCRVQGESFRKKKADGGKSVGWSILRRKLADTY